MRLDRWLLVTVVSAILSSSAASGQAAKTNPDDPERQQAMQLYQEHKLPEAAALLMHPDQGIAQDYAAYQAAHREKLIQFVDEYILPQAP